MSLRERTSLKISRELRQALILYRVRTGTVAEKQSVAWESVVEVEQALGTSLPEELLAVFAATGRDPYEMLVLTEEAREADYLPADLVAVSMQRSEQGVARTPMYWCLAKDVAQEGRCEIVRWALDPKDRRSGLSVLDLVQACYLDGPPTDDEATAVRGLSAKFRPAIVSQPRTAFRRVSHHRFGAGFVLREFNDGNQKVEVQFPSVGVKLLLASYVQEAPDADARLIDGAKRAKAAPARRRP
ncbi:MAG: hypothetical protein WCE62_20820 [Polyangiales bacterium]